MRVVTLAWLAFIAAISLMPLKFKYRMGTTGAWHYPGHFLIFLITSVLLCRAGRSASSRMLRCLGICSFALGMEVLEYVAYHNPMEWRDVLIDCFGAVLGLMMLSAFPSPQAAQFNPNSNKQ